VRFMEFGRLFSVLLFPVVFYGQSGFVGQFIITVCYAMASLVWLIPIQKHLLTADMPKGVHPSNTVEGNYSSE